MRSAKQYYKEFKETNFEVGRGSLGRVCTIMKKRNNQIYAAKMVKTKNERQKALANKEYSMLSKINHKNIIKMIAAFDLKSACVFIMEYHSGGTLQTKVNEHVLTEGEAVVFLRQICEALVYLHNKKIAHCDIKPDNVMIIHPNSTQVKIIDFGMAHVLDGQQQLSLAYGATNYMAPEMILLQPVSVLVDMWSLGVMTYYMLSGYLPFNSTSYKIRKENVKSGLYTFNSAFNDTSKLALDFIEGLLVKIDPEGSRKRLTATEARRHPWLLLEKPKKNVDTERKKREFDRF